MDDWRQTGRTTAAAREALRMGGGHMVLFLSATQQESDHVRRLMVDELEVYPNAMANITFASVRSDNFEKLRGHSFYKVVIDHHTWETAPFRTAGILVSIASHVVEKD